MKRRVWTSVLATSAATAGALALMPTAAQAAPAIPSAALVPAGCVVGPQQYECNTAAVEAGDGVVWINVNTGIAAPCHYYVRDIMNGNSVRNGAIAGHYATRITGLYSWYRLELRWCTSGSTGAIS